MFIGASLSLKSLCCLRDGARSSRLPRLRLPVPRSRGGSLPPSGVGGGRSIREGPPLVEKGEKERSRTSTCRRKKRRKRVGKREPPCRGARGKIYLPRESCGREIESRESEQTDDRRRASTALRTQEPRERSRSRNRSRSRSLRRKITDAEEKQPSTVRDFTINNSEESSPRTTRDYFVIIYYIRR
ncbi:hypothetical protein PUN28_013504 [Cardiocondyla obscurior]|uniref:Uncharacterized protein n=1 Tax=Cardiocondyla obscurior TaxID=286306 RepID=A0AAW2F6Q3_9HYME